VYVRFASNVMRVDEVSDITSVSTVLQQCTDKVVRLNIQFEITYSTTVVEFNTTMALVVLMEQCNFISAGTETVATGHFTLQTIYKGVPHLYYLSELRGLVVKKLDPRTLKTDVLSKETYLLNIFLAAQFKFKDVDLEYFLFR